MAEVNKLESRLEDVFVKSAPKLPEDVTKLIAEYAPYINLFAGIVSLWTAYQLYRWATVVDRLNDYVNEFARPYGVDYVTSSRLSVGIWVAVAVMAIQGILWVAAFPSAKEKSKSGWNLMFYAALVNAVYGLVVLFTDYGTVGTLIGYLVGTAAGLYVLFQIRSYFLGNAGSTAPVAKSEAKSKSSKK